MPGPGTNCAGDRGFPGAGQGKRTHYRPEWRTSSTAHRGNPAGARQLGADAPSTAYWPPPSLWWRDREASPDGERIRVGDDATIRLIDALPATGVAIVAHGDTAEAVARRPRRAPPRAPRSRSAAGQAYRARAAEWSAAWPRWVAAWASAAGCAPAPHAANSKASPTRRPTTRYRRTRRVARLTSFIRGDRACCRPAPGRRAATPCPRQTVGAGRSGPL